jgi:hypothetical protein
MLLSQRRANRNVATGILRIVLILKQKHLLGNPIAVQNSNSLNSLEDNNKAEGYFNMQLYITQNIFTQIRLFF